MSSMLDRIRQAWVAADRAAERMEELGVDPEQWRGIIHGEISPTEGDLAMISEACDVSLEWLRGKK